MKIITDRSQLYDDKFYRNSNLFIEAGAGAGKTRSIESKIVDQLVQGIPPSKFVVITFTNKASEDMKERINKTIIKQSQNAKGEAKEILTIAANTLYQMQISTIHAFCNRIINEFSFESEVPYGVTLLENDASQARSDALFYEWKRTLSYEDFDILDNLNLPEQRNGMSYLKKTYDGLCELFDDAEIVTKIPSGFNECIDYLLCAQNILDTYGDLKLSKSGVAVREIVDKYDYAHMQETKENIKKVHEAVKIITGKNSYFNGSSDDVESSKNEIKEMHEKYAIAVCRLNKADYNIVNDYAIKAWNYYKEHRDAATITQNELIYKVTKLAEDSEIIKKIAKNIDVIYIDEFQDTDPKQIKFIMSLGEAISSRKKKEGKITTSLFIVGDPKQSIYRFRGSDIASYNTANKNFSIVDSKNNVNLFFPDNYRSNDLIINYVNDSYREEKLGDGCIYKDMIVGDDHVLPKNGKSEKVLGGVYSFPFSKETKYKDVVNLIKYLVKEKYEIYDWDNNCCLRKIKYSDFLILTCSKSDIPDFALELFNNGVPSNIQGKFSIGISDLMRINYRILFYILNHDENNKTLAIDTLTSYDDNPEQKLEEIYNNTLSLSSYAKFLYVFKNFKLESSFINDNKINLYDSALQQLFEKVCVNDNVTDSELLLKIEQYITTYEETEITLVDDEFDQKKKALDLSKEGKVEKDENFENQGVVRIMNAHKSKGLQGQIVFIIDSGGLARDGNIETANGKAYVNCIDCFKGAKDQSKKESGEEHRRIEYVDVTRAKQVLVFDSEFPRGLRLFSEKTFTNEELAKYQLPNTSLPSYESINPQNDENLLNSFVVESFYKSTLDKELVELNRFETSPSKLEEETVLDKNENTFSIRRPRGNVFGDALHRAMELYVLSKGNRPINEITNQVIKEQSEYINTDELVSYYQKFLIECAQSIINYFNEIKLFDNKLFTEYKFISKDLIDGKEYLISGSIDLLTLTNDNKAIIFDYKSDIAGFVDENSFEKKLAKKYSPELNAYRNFVYKTFNVSQVNLKLIWVEETDKKEIARCLDIN